MRLDAYRRYFSKAAFLRKTKKLTKPVLERAVLLYLVMLEKDTPASVKLAIAAVLGYLILPFDVIPDYLPFGYVDDVSVMSALLTLLDKHISPELRERAKRWR